jgi:hypothetical protein
MTFDVDSTSCRSPAVCLTFNRSADLRVPALLLGLQQAVVAAVAPAAAAPAAVAAWPCTSPAEHYTPANKGYPVK